MTRLYFIFIVLSFLLFPGSRLAAQEMLTWDGCLEEARKNNPDLISAEEAISQRKSDKLITASGLYPQIDLDLGASTSKATSRSATTGATSTTTTDSYSYGLSGTQLLFDGFKKLNEISAASQDISAAQHSYRFTSSGVRLELRIAFINLLEAQELVRVTEDIYNIRRNSLELITLRYHSGLEHKGALLTAEANLASANSDVSQARRSIELAQRQLTKAMGRKEFKPMLVKGDFSVKDSVKSKPDFEQLADNNPSLLEAAAKKNSAAFSVKSAYADFYPKLTGSGGTGRSDSHWPARNKQWDAGLSVSLPVFEGGLRFAQVSKAKAAYRQAEADERSLKDSVIVNLEQAWISLQDAIEIVGVQRKILEAAEERARISEAQYSTGFMTFDNWIIIEDDLVTAKRSYLNVQADAILAEANWIQAKGETLEYAQE